MRVLASTTAGSGHFTPMVPILRACASAGHEILVACPRSFTEDVRRAGFPTAPFDDAPGREVAAIFEGLAGKSYEEGNRIVVRDVFATLGARSALAGLTATVAGWRPDVILREPSEYASWLVAEDEDVATVRVAIGLLSSESRYAGVAVPALEAVSDDAGLHAEPTVDRLLDAPVLASAPASFDPPGDVPSAAVHRYAPPRQLTPTTPHEPPSGEEPLVYVTFGTVAASLGLWPKAYRAVIDALADAPSRVLVTTGSGTDPSVLGPLPRGTAVEQFVPQDDVLARATVMVTHGGFGTVVGGLRYGVPMVVTPMFADQRDNAVRVQAAGVGIHVDVTEEPMAIPRGWGEAVREAVLQLLDDQDARETVEMLAEEAESHPSIDTAVAIIERTARSAG